MDHVLLRARGTPRTLEAEQQQDLGAVLPYEQWLSTGSSSLLLKTKLMPFTAASTTSRLLVVYEWEVVQTLGSLGSHRLVLGICLPSRKQKHLWKILLSSDIMWNIWPGRLAIKVAKIIRLLFSLPLVYPTIEIHNFKGQMVKKTYLLNCSLSVSRLWLLHSILKTMWDLGAINFFSSWMK